MSQEKNIGSIASSLRGELQIDSILANSFLVEVLKA
jgi:hypothetical protein